MKLRKWIIKMEFMKWNWWNEIDEMKLIKINWYENIKVFTIKSI